MSNSLDKVKIGPPVSLGEPVEVRIGQASEIVQLDNGSLMLYTVSNGSPSIFYAVELPSGEVTYTYEIPHSHAVWAMTKRGQDVYFCATDDGLLYRFSQAIQAVEIVGTFPSGHFVWDLNVAYDGKVYGGTYPNAEVFEYDPETNQFQDLGRMIEEQFYVRSVRPVDDYVFAGTGSMLHFMQYDRTTGLKQELNLEVLSGEPGFIHRIFKANLPNRLFLFVDKHSCILYNYEQQVIEDTFRASCYVSEPSPYNGEQYFEDETKLYSYNCETKQVTERAQLPIVNDEKIVKKMTWVNDEHGDAVLVITNTTMEVLYYYPVTGKVELVNVQVPACKVQIQSLEWDGEDRLYIGGYHRGLCIYNTTNGQAEKNYTNFAQIEGMGFSEGKVYFGTYTKANIYAYDPTHTIAEDPYFLFKITHDQDRPFAFTEAEDKLFFGTIADYGILSGAIAMYDKKTGEHKTYPNVVPNQSIIGLAYKDGLVYGGTTNWGGMGIEPTETEAKLFVWDIASEKVIHSFTPEVPGIDIPPRMIGDLRFGPDGLLWGAVDGSIFALCVQTMKVVKGKMIYPSEYKYTHLRPYFLRWSDDGLLFTALAKKLIVIDPETLEHKVLEEGPLPLMTLGPNGDVYYNDEGHLIKRERLS